MRRWMRCSRRSTSRLQAELVPQRIDPALHRRVHNDRTAPRARGLLRPLARGVDAELRAEAGERAREVEVIDRRALGDEQVVRWIHPCAERPDDFLPVAAIAV